MCQGSERKIAKSLHGGEAFVGKSFCTFSLLLMIIITLQQTENSTRQHRGEAPLSEEDLNKIFKPLQSPSRLDYLLLSQQVNTYCKQVNQFSTQSFGKLFLSQALQDKE